MLAAALLLLLPGVSPAADSPWLYGIHWYGDPASDEVEVMTGSKGIWDLEIVLTEDAGAWSAGGQLAKFQTIVARGHTLIIRIHPRWNLVVPGPNTPETAVGDRMETFIPKLVDAAQQLSDVCHIWQIGNEMNLGFEYDIGDLTPQLYVEKYNEIRSAIHTVSSSLGPQIVLLGPVAPVDNAYLGAMCDALTANGYEVDGFAMHGYGGSRGNFLPDIQVQADFIDSKGYTDKPIYVTEWGAPVDPISDTNEAGVAQFLHAAFQDLANYNANPANHDVVCACWFVYREDIQWQNWSILGLHDVHPPGINNDLYDAFQYACTLDLPAGEGGPPPTGPWITRTPAALSPSAPEGSNAPDDTFTIANSGTGTLDYTITDNVTWLSVAPSDGISTGETDTITVDYSTATLPFGSYTGTITISVPQAGNSPQTIAVDLQVQSTSIPPEIVNPGFGDDAGFFNVATGWTGFGGTKWERVWDPEHPVAQGVSEIAVAGECGVYQTIDVVPGIIYRVSMLAKSHTSDHDVSIGVDPAGGTSSGGASFGTTSTSTSWTQVSADVTASGPSATIFLRARNVSPLFHTGLWSVFDDVAIEIVGTSNHSPTAAASADPLTGDVPLTVNFDGGGSSDPDPGDTLTYNWDFGDDATGQGVADNHTYTDPDVYTVILIVTDGKGGIDTDTLSVTVTDGGSFAPPDFDRDGDVDLEDFGHLQACLTGSGVEQNDPHCLDARLDSDIDVDQDDFALLPTCLTGPDLPADPDCDN